MKTFAVLMPLILPAADDGSLSINCDSRVRMIDRLLPTLSKAPTWLIVSLYKERDKAARLCQLGKSQEALELVHEAIEKMAPYRADAERP